jgi:hypothetical protein
MKRKKKCRHCKRLFIPDHRNSDRQRYCSKEECRKASKTASQKKWWNKPENRDYFRGPLQVERVREWRKKHPGYSLKKRPDKRAALQDALTRQPVENKEDKHQIASGALQDLLRRQEAVIAGLISNITGSVLQDDIVETLLRMEQSGHDILYGQPIKKEGGRDDCKTSDFTEAGPEGSPRVWLDRSPSG